MKERIKVGAEINEIETPKNIKKQQNRKLVL
jgi:hypothetical protein